MYKVGVAKVEIQFEGEGFGMMGYGRAFNVIKGRFTPLYCRSFCFENEGEDRLFFVQAEICMVFPEIKRELLDRLQRNYRDSIFRDDNIMLTGQHTHSAPAGFSHYPMYNFSVPGFRPHVFEAVVRAFYDAIVRSYENVQDAVLKFGYGDFPEEEEVGFNRSLAAYNANPEVKKRKESETHLAIERTMFLLKVENPDGDTLGQINWFGVHPTSLGNRIHLISYDNKGYAAEYLEQDLGEGSVSIFAQQFAGDVSPNFHGVGKKWPKGKYKDDIESAKFNGRLQSNQALRILAKMDNRNKLLSGQMDSEVIYRDFSKVNIHPEFTGGKEDERTWLPCHGIAFLKGTPVDGRGMPDGIATLAISISKSIRQSELNKAKILSPEKREAIEAKYKAQDPKDIAFETGEGRVMGSNDIQNLFIPGILDGTIMQMKKEHRDGALKELPWSPVVLPLQYFRLGELAIIGFPGEITTEAGRQLRDLCAEILKEAGIRYVVISTYANSYFGYCTTFEEYQLQLYEGGHTVFGSRTHDAFRTEFKNMLSECLKPKKDRKFERNPKPKVFSDKEITLRTINSKRRS
jgi:neutral ceramidase